MNDISSLITHNMLCLQQGLDLLDELDDETYTHTAPPFYESSIGDHLRHSLEHYESFFAGLHAGSVDYDARRRDVRIATSRTFAARTVQDVIARLETMASRDKPLLVKMDCGEDTDAAWSPSSVQRELQYLQAHTIHHYALIAVALRLQRKEVHEDFGVAPSTLKYRRRVSPTQ